VIINAGQIRKLSIILVVFMIVTVHVKDSGATILDSVKVIDVPKVIDFSLGEAGGAPQWKQTEWTQIPQRNITERMSRNIAPGPAETVGQENLFTKVKVLYSNTGLYFLFRCEDRVLQATMSEDFKELWWEDVVEIFLWPDESKGVYYEYQISPLNYIRFTKHNRDFNRSNFLKFKNESRKYHDTSVEGGGKKSGSSISGWTAEIFIPYDALEEGQHIRPEPGSIWRANLYRFDYDTGDRAHWEWAPVHGRNHRVDLFGMFHFQ
jgi:hypothetical protein